MTPLHAVSTQLPPHSLTSGHVSADKLLEVSTRFFTSELFNFLRDRNAI